MPDGKKRAEMKARQTAKIMELGQALAADGVLNLDDQARALGLCRSTTWNILKANHKNSGLSATIINRVLKSPQLPPRVRATVLKYIEEKAAGLYGHTKKQQRAFAARVSSAGVAHPRTKLNGTVSKGAHEA